MTNEEFDRRIDALTKAFEAQAKTFEAFTKEHAAQTEKHKALVESVELMRDSHNDLSAAVRAMVRNTAEQRERDREHFRMLAAILKSLADGNGNGNGDSH